MTKALVHIVDDALPRARFEALRRAIQRLGVERLRSSYQTTCWYALDEAPTNVIEDAVQGLRARLPTTRLRGVIGVEWWLSRMRTSNVRVDFHRDRDNARFDETSLEVHPALSTVLYLNRCRGGLLAVTAQPPNPANRALAPDRHDFDLVEPRANRLAWFDGRLTHGVLDARNRIPGGRLPREPRLRLAIAINFWSERPWRVPTFERLGAYRALSRRFTASARTG